MMNHILLVAAREFRQIAATRSFWVTLLILPLAFAIGPVASRFLDDSDTQRIMLIDRSGGTTAQAIAARIDLDEQRRVLTQFSRYVESNRLEAVDPEAPWARHDRWYSDADVAAFVAAGGADGALAKVRAKGGEVPDFDAPDPAYTIVPVPAPVAAAPPEAIGQALEGLLRPGEGSKAKPLDYAVYIPADFGRSPDVRLWANGAPSSGFVTMVQGLLAQELKVRYLQANGVAAPVAAASTQIAPAIAVVVPPRGSGRERVLIRSILPLACAYILLMSLILSGSWMLQGSVEERSNKLIETVLACVSPNELMYGKLIGTVGIGLSMVATWAACGIVAAFATQGAIAEMIRPALEPVSSFGAIATILYFFVAGYIVVAMIFLVIGAVSDSMRDAQGYLTPVLMVIMIPVTVLVQAVLRGATGPAVELLTWIPIWTPFAVLARLGTGMPLWQVWAAGALTAAFIVVEVILLGRIFRASLLAGGGRPKLAGLIGLMRRPG
ncbi:ABC transporter permease [uncultured Sphingomonas sp.]|uniref:ABC transporter permease n=1 Tax=uncultured Sphingomonas sp. TaxID=158754 RepID=UPI0025F8414F|nr:ABC transporter permease [uncultured Sphingomonas sp.]